MSDLPRLALSIRQPWAWAIVSAGKDVENRTWTTTVRGPVCIHASAGLTLAEYDAFGVMVRSLVKADAWPQEAWLPPFKDLQRGGIVGVANITDCVTRSRSAWFTGPKGFVMTNVRPVEFIPLKGALNFFDWRKRLEADHV